MTGVTRVRAGGLLFDGGPGDVTYSIEPDGLKGVLKGGVGVRRDNVPRPVAHGEHALRAWRTGRAISWEGIVETKGSPAEHDQALLRLQGLGADGEPFRVVFDTAAGSFWCDVQITGAPDVSRLVYGRLSSYRVSVYAVDPWLFGETVSFPPGLVFHRGNADASPVVEVTGPSSGWSVTAASSTVAVTQALTAGQTHRYETETGRLFRNGVLQTTGLAAAGSWLVRSGQRVSHSFTGSGSAVVKVTDTFI